MLLRLTYLGATKAFAMLRLLATATKTWRSRRCVIIAVLERQLGGDRPQFGPSDRAFLAALLYRLPRDALRRLRLLVPPDTVLRWHRNLVARHHAAFSAEALGPATYRGLHPRRGTASGSGLQ